MGENTSTNSKWASANNYYARLLWGKMILEDRTG